MHIHFIVHEHFESPGACLHWAQDRGYTIGWSRVYAGDPLPANADGFDMLVVLGGPQSPRTTLAECAYFDTHAEQNLIAQAIAAGRIVIGICLGSQLIGEALGAPVMQSPEKEIGHYPVTLSVEGLRDPNIAHFGPALVVGHWHNDMPGMTPTATVLAASEGCPRQIVKYGDRVYGFQCHMEFDAEVIERLITHSQEELEAARSVQEMRSWDYREMNQKLWTFLDNLVTHYRH
ncbi:type 1 glutamine amidotransferase [Raoultella ornithinolytica]|uniref:type 1 glutamine amidotransferase n=1 Tax=Raoultella ornithinolytica TaxID=54291 RepID=UPI000ED34BE1|nr:type 1 glutamine amidotransferase [Raoultella ornithinolytica]EKQ7998084.1 type 1 glutamine amidotransferase [Raoultella ornithinolytica]EKU0196768.1 type 1 glutamine amidotransferase [Raoultella ornithinolytica]EKV4101193.1 type 1 glutamine amidotransferase [Raoultella ornithinolytica]EKV8285325.1 type 1 glutamine amidotransferase [Raoultella ornithinolytica]EKW3193097.1 type 1 glutamine amidotransferase [Raoultella ornithinolytica]